MKKILYILILLPIMVIGQTQSENYVQKTTYKTATTSSISSPTPIQTVQIVTYYDGLGRPIQQVANQQSATGKNIVTPIEYDAFGRQVKEYLPYATTTNGLDYETGALTDVGTFYNTAAYQNTQNPYSEKLLENSPLNRVLQQATPGTDWALGNTHEIKLDYQTNTANDVKYYQVANTWDSGNKVYDILLVDNGYYDQNQLYKNITKNENWSAANGDDNTVQEYKDKDGRIVLKRTFNNGTPYETYYVYDVYGNLTYVIPPMVTNPNDATQMDELCYQYKYDYRNRLVEKKLPGKQWEYMVYDKLDRVVATGPALSPFSDISDTGWMITKYDVFNRPVYTGWLQSAIASSGDRYALQQIIDTNSLICETKTSTANTIDGISVAYSNNVNPTGIKLLTVNYYDDYSFPNVAPTPTSVLNQPVLNNVKGMQTETWTRVLSASNATDAEINIVFYDSKSRVIFSRTSNYLGGTTDVQNLYNFAGQVLQTITVHNRTNDVDKIFVTEDFEYTPQGRLLNHFHTVNNGQKELIAHNDYDELGKLITKNVGGQDITTFVGLQKVDYSYNIRGWLTGINDIAGLSQNSDPDDLFAFKINYNDIINDGAENTTALYNGNIAQTYWLTSSDNVLRKYGYQYDALNRLNTATYIKPDLSVPVTNSYDETVSYDKNGNIMSMYRNGNFDDDNGMKVNIDDLTYTYKNNNNTSNQLMKVTDATNDPNGFKDDTDNDPTDANDDYAYDANGNMIRDDNKGIQSITYNHLNLPTTIDFGSLGRINYFYDATGKKLRKEVLDNNTAITTITDYLDGFQYKNAAMQFFPTAEGYVNVTQNNSVVAPDGKAPPKVLFKYVYNYVDHLGNIRLSYSQDPATGVLKIIEENHYYPFGLKHSNYNTDKKMIVKEEIPLALTAVDPGLELKIKPETPLLKSTYNYKYNGKELQDELGLNMYDYGARLYDPARAGWSTVDPRAEQMRRWSPYNYCFDNPMRFTDPDGMGPDDWVKRIDGSVHWDKNVNNTAQAEAKYGTGATDIGKEVTYESELNTTVNLHDGGKWDSNIVIGNKVPEEQKIETESVFDLKTAGEITQNIGDAVTAIGICTGQPEICAIGEVVGKIGLAAVITADIMDKGLTNATAISSGVKIGLSIGFGALGKAGVNATRTVAGHEAVEAGANKVSEGIIQATTMATEKTLGNAIEQKVDPKINEE